MQCLWLTLADPEPATNGQLIYSKGLIEAACRAGASLAVIGLARPDNPRPSAEARTIDWRLADERRKSAGRRLLARDPTAAQRGSPQMQYLLERALAQRPWDAVVFDSICAGWALPHVLRHRVRSAQPPRLVYVAHNHEVTVARSIATAAQGLRRIAKEIDCLKVIGLERRFIAAADTVTSNTPDDCRRFAADSQRPTDRVPAAQAMAGRASPSGGSTPRVPRRAIVVGSFDWPPKRISLEPFLDAAAPDRMASAGMSSCRSWVRSRPAISPICAALSHGRFVGPVADVRPYMQAARIALVPDLLGGFKLKGLDYVFNRLPDPVDADRLARHAVGGRTQRRSVRQPQGAGRRRCRADRRFSRAQCAAGISPMTPADALRLGPHRSAPRARTCGGRPTGEVQSRDRRSDSRRSVSAGSPGGRKMKL